MPLSRRLLYWIPVAVWMALIFLASADSLSAARGSRYLAPILKWLFPGLSAASLDSLMLLIRKGAHVAEYAVLAILVWSAQRGAAASEPQGWQKRHAFIALLVVLGYAITDELHQTIVPSRIGTPVDVLIDTMGGLVGLAFVWVIGKALKRW